jgi:hypothetical protein
MTSLQSKKYLVLNYWILLLKKGPFFVVAASRSRVLAVAKLWLA